MKNEHSPRKLVRIKTLSKSVACLAIMALLVTFLAPSASAQSSLISVDQEDLDHFSVVVELLHGAGLLDSQAMELLSVIQAETEPTVRQDAWSTVRQLVHKELETLFSNPEFADEATALFSDFRPSATTRAYLMTLTDQPLPAVEASAEEWHLALMDLKAQLVGGNVEAEAIVIPDEPWTRAGALLGSTSEDQELPCRWECVLKFWACVAWCAVQAFLAFFVCGPGCMFAVLAICIIDCIIKFEECLSGCPDMSSELLMTPTEKRMPSVLYGITPDFKIGVGAVAS